MLLRARQFAFQFPRPVLVMGVVNVTPDSFSDGGRFLDASAAIDHGLRLVAEGADILDIGGESTRPGAAPVGAEEERRRVLPVARELVRTSKVPVPVSIDTMKVEVARAALEAGASIINDVAAHRRDPEMWRLVRDSGAGYVVMHMQGTPETMQRDPQYRDVVAEVAGFFSERLARLDDCGVAREQTLVDPGIGFGKTVQHNLQLLGGLGHLTTNQRPLLVGVSRKAFIAQLTDAKDIDERLPGSLACACLAVAAGAKIIRTHDVAATRRALRMAEAILANHN